MSSALISRSPDLCRLRDEGYAVAIIDGLLVLKDVPFLSAERNVQRGQLISTLQLAGDVTTGPIADHVAHLAGGVPHDAAGQPMERLIHVPSPTQLSAQLRSDVSFSSKPLEGYPDYHAKMTAYVRLLEAEAHAVDPDATARTFRVVDPDEQDSPFLYLDTSSTRAGIAAESAKLAVGPVAIIGLGGTGAYVLDLLAKTPIRELHLFDGDAFLQHNAFRAPGATGRSALEARQSKADHWAGVYCQMRRGVMAHPYAINESSVGELDGMHSVFVCIDDGAAKRAIFDHLAETEITFIDVGMGLFPGHRGGLAGQLRVTTSTPQARQVRERVPLDDAGADDPYSTNIQIADLNALNAALAVVRWKKLLGFYVALEDERHSLYTIDGNHLLNETP